MGAPTGNRFWENRSKHGRDMLFSSPTLLWEAAQEYFEWCEDNPLMETDFRGRDSDKVEIPKMRAFTFQGLCLYLDCGTNYFNQLEGQFKDKDDDRAKDFSVIIQRIRDIIYTQKFTGAAAGFLHPMIISRDLGLRDNQSVDTNVNVQGATIIDLGNGLITKG